MNSRLAILCLVFFCAGGRFAQAQDKPEYAASLIPDSLTTNALSVIRNEVQELTVSAPGRASLKKKKVVTALNAKGEAALSFWEYEDKFRSLGFAEVRLYDAKGNFVRKYKKKEMEKVRGLDDENLVSDIKMYYKVIDADSYPVTAEFTSETELSGFIDFSEFRIAAPNQSIQQSRYSVTSTADNPVRYKSYYCNLQPVIQEAGKNKLYTWTVNGVHAFVPEAGVADKQGSLPHVVITPTRFEMDGYAGDFNSWENYGRWYWSMSLDAGELPLEKKAQIISLVSGITDERQKVKALYEYLQHNYRYVSIQLGIGGFKPFPASYVDKNKYGDCKALSNYMQAILQVAGIKSYQALINAGSKGMPLDPQFANNPFNHVILCVPQPKDTIWLDCTSQDAPFGRLGSFTENRYALLITEHGGVVTATPESTAADNVLATTSEIQFNEDGSGKATVTIRHSGEEHNDMKAYCWNRDEAGRKEYLVRWFGFKQFDEYKLEKVEIPGHYASKLELNYEKIQDFNAGSKYFLRPHLYTIWDTPLGKGQQRVTDYFFDHPFARTDSTVYLLPEGFVAESMPKPVQLQFSLGSFETRYSFDAADKKLVCWSRLVVEKQRVPVADFARAKVFFDQVIKECEQKIIVKKQ